MKEIEYLKIDELIAKTRKQQGISQRKLAQLLKTKPAAVCRFEKPGYNFTLRTLKRIAEALNRKLVIKFK